MSKEILTQEELKTIRSFKLLNGEEVVASLTKIEDDAIIVKLPCKIIYVKSESGGINATLTKWHQFSDDDSCIIFTQSIISYAQVNPEMFKLYINCIQHNFFQDLDNDPNNSWPDWMDNLDPIKDKNKIN